MYPTGNASLFSVAARTTRQAEFTYHFLVPEQLWGVFADGVFVAVFGSADEARDYCDRHNGQ